MKWLSVKHEYHPKRTWHPYGFAWRPVEINLVTYWLCNVPYDIKLVDDRWVGTVILVGGYVYEVRAHAS